MGCVENAEGADDGVIADKVVLIPIGRSVLLAAEFRGLLIVRAAGRLDSRPVLLQLG